MNINLGRVNDAVSFMMGVVLLGYAAYPTTDAVACEACLSDGKPEPNESSICFEAPDGPGEICKV